jgi:hypothetical protein
MKGEQRDVQLPHVEAATAIGAAIAQVSGEVRLGPEGIRAVPCFPARGSRRPALNPC